MKIAVSGTHFMGKTTLIEGFVAQHPDYSGRIEPYYALLEQGNVEPLLEPSLDGLQQELEYSIEQLNECEDDANVIFDRCPVDYLAYAMCTLEKESSNLSESHFVEYFSDIKEALDNLDYIFFLAMTDDYIINYTEENPAYRIAADACFKKLYFDEVCDIFPGYNHPRIITITGERAVRIEQINTILGC